MTNATLLEERLNYRFQNQKLLERALTHTSYLHEHENEKDIEDNERLEFLGDAVLQLAVSQELFLSQLDADEGMLSTCRAALVNQETLAALARTIDLGSHLRLGQGEIKQHGAQKSSILSDALEAVLGAIYLESGAEKAFSVIVHLLRQWDAEAFHEVAGADHKQMLQMKVEQEQLGHLHYETVGVGGSDHEPVFKAVALIDDRAYGTGRGSSKKKAQMQAAQQALFNLSK